MDQNDFLDSLHNLYYLLESSSKGDQMRAGQGYINTLIDAQKVGLLDSITSELEKKIRSFLYIIDVDEVAKCIKRKSPNLTNLIFF